MTSPHRPQSCGHIQPVLATGQLDGPSQGCRRQGSPLVEGPLAVAAIQRGDLEGPPGRLEGPHEEDDRVFPQLAASARIGRETCRELGLAQSQRSFARSDRTVDIQRRQLLETIDDWLAQQ